MSKTKSICICEIAKARRDLDATETVERILVDYVTVKTGYGASGEVTYCKETKHVC